MEKVNPFRSYHIFLQLLILILNQSLTDAQFKVIYSSSFRSLQPNITKRDTNATFVQITPITTINPVEDKIELSTLIDNFTVTEPTVTEPTVTEINTEKNINVTDTKINTKEDRKRIEVYLEATHQLPQLPNFQLPKLHERAVLINKELTDDRHRRLVGKPKVYQRSILGDNSPIIKVKQFSHNVLDKLNPIRKIDDLKNHISSIVHHKKEAHHDSDIEIHHHHYHHHQHVQKLKIKNRRHHRLHRKHKYRKYKSKCRCEKISNCRRIQISNIGRCENDYFLCC